MQEILTVTVGGKKIISKTFDFKATCMINEMQNKEGVNGPLMLTKDAVDYMFEGTDATQDVIDALPVGEHVKLCLELWNIYIKAITAKNA